MMIKPLTSFPRATNPRLIRMIHKNCLPYRHAFPQSPTTKDASKTPTILEQTYHTTENGHGVKLDVVIYPEVLEHKEKKKGLIISFHGGGLTMGSRKDESSNHPFQDTITLTNSLLISANYRLLIPSTGHSISQDISHLLTYLSSSKFISLLPNAITPDLTKIVAIGFSGGGYPLRLLGIQAALEGRKPRKEQEWKVKGLVNYFGMGGDWLSDDWVKKRSHILDEDIPEGKGEGYWYDKVKTLYEGPDVREWSEDPYCTTRHEYHGIRDAMYEYWCTSGTYLDALTGIKGLGKKLSSLSYEDRRRVTLEDKDSKSKLKDIFPQLWLEDANNAKDFPAMVAVHGNADRAIRYSESVLTHEALRKGGNKRSELITIDDGSHTLWEVDAEGKPRPQRGVEEANKKVKEFIIDCLK